MKEFQYKKLKYFPCQRKATKYLSFIDNLNQVSYIENSMFIYNT